MYAQSCSHLVRGVSFLPLPHLKCVILKALVYKEDQVRSSPRCCRDKDFYVDSVKTSWDYQYQLCLISHLWIFTKNLSWNLQFLLRDHISLIQREGLDRTAGDHWGELKDLNFLPQSLCKISWYTGGLRKISNYNPSVALDTQKC